MRRSQIVFLIVVIPICFMIFDFAIGFCLHVLIEKLNGIQSLLLFFTLYLLAGALLACMLHQIILDNQQKTLSILLLATVLFVLIRGTLSYYYLGGIVLTSIMSAFLEALVTFPSLFLFSFIINSSKDKFGDYSIKNLELTKEKAGVFLRQGNCSNCGKKIVSTKDRTLPFWGAAEKYFCNHCGVFIKGNPVRSLIEGLAIIVLAMAFFINYFFYFLGDSPNFGSINSVLVLVFLVGIWDGFVRVIMSIAGMSKHR